MSRITTDQAISMANSFCNKNAISSWKKREALSILIAEVYYLGYEAGIDDLKDAIKRKERTNVG